MDHETGKSLKLNANDMSDMQTLLAECLDMERGVSKEQTDRRHLAREDYIIAKQQEKAEQAKADRDAALADKEAAEKERTALEKETAEMERKIAEERKGKRG